jgi:thymidylate kinase
LIYEGYGAGVSKSLIIKLHKLVMPEPYFKPDKVVILTLSDEERAKRLKSQSSEQGRTGEIWKSQPEEFQERLRAAYLKVAEDYNVPTLSAAGTVPEVQAELRKLFNL